MQMAFYRFKDPAIMRLLPNIIQMTIHPEAQAILAFEGHLSLLSISSYLTMIGGYYFNQKKHKSNIRFDFKKPY